MEGPKSRRPSLFFVLKTVLGVCISSNVPLAVWEPVRWRRQKPCWGSTQTVSSLDNNRPELQPEPMPLFTSTDMT